MLHGTFLRPAAAECGISLTTSFRWRHKFLKLTDNLAARKLEGIVEIDETQFNLSEKGNRHLERKPRKRGTDKATSKIKVVVAKDRSGHIYDKVMRRFTLADLKPDYHITNIDTDAFWHKKKALCDQLEIKFLGHRRTHVTSTSSIADKMLCHF